LKELVNILIDYNNDCLKLVERENGVVSYRAAPLSYSCFIEQGQLGPELDQKIRSLHEVKSVELDGKYLRINWRDRESCRKFCFSAPELKIQTYDGDVSPIRRYLTDTGRKVAAPRSVFLDIETDSRVPFSRKEEMRILCWTLVDKVTGQEFRGMLEDDNDEAEQKLLLALFEELGNYDQIISWNGDRFDFPVIKERAKLRKIRLETRRWLWLDHLELFRRMNISGAESGEEKVSFALEAIAQAVLGRGKSDYDSSKTWEGYCEDRQRLADYCAIDTQLMRDIELKNGYIDLFHTLCDVCSTFPDTYGINPSGQVEGFLLAIAKERGFKFKTRLERSKDPSDQYRGAFVLAPTKSGMIKDVHVCDFTSLYPSIIITWNISPETKCATRESYCSETPGTGHFYDTRVTGILPYAVMELMRLRKEWQAKEKSLTPNTPEWHEAHRKSTAYKIAANTFYGVVGSPMSRFFDRNVAESVTQSGVWLNKRIAKEAEDLNMKVLAMDTDSVLVYGTTKQEFLRFVFDFCNEELIPKLLLECGCKEARINLDYDKAYERLFIPEDEDGKPISKKYCGRIAHSKGKEATDDSEPEVKGLEYKRGDSVRIARGLQKTIIDLLCKARCEDPITLAAVCTEYKTKVLNEPLEVEEVSISKRLSKSLSQYKEKLKLDRTPAAQPPHVEVAKILGSRGKDVNEGSKISYVVIDGSTSPKKVIPADDWDGNCDRFELWDSWVWPPVRRILGPAFPEYDWTQFDRTRPPKVRGKKKPTVDPRQLDLCVWIDEKMKEKQNEGI
jgi:DNA polymerase, archaea type